MKRGANKFTIGIVVVLAVVVTLAGFSYFNRTTGKASFTTGANYGPVSPGFNVLVNCEYVGTDDGWDVTKKSKIKYFDKTKGIEVEMEDHCALNDRSVREYHCEDGYAKTRIVNCPNQMRCDQGVCVSA